MLPPAAGCFGLLSGAQGYPWLSPLGLLVRTFSNETWSLTRSSKTMAYALESLPTLSPSSGRFTSGVPSFSQCFLPFSWPTGEGAFASSQIFLPLMHFHLSPVGLFTLYILDLTCSANLTGCRTITEGETLDVGRDNLISESSEGSRRYRKMRLLQKLLLLPKLDSPTEDLNQCRRREGCKLEPVTCWMVLAVCRTRTSLTAA